MVPKRPITAKPQVEAQEDPDLVDVTPPKRFFVEMLTRDIELEDAILDLLDNCVDGAVRVNAAKQVKPDPKVAYDGFWAKIELNEDGFCIRDNCGGIPKDVARDYAFQFGRPRAGIDNSLQTVGVYGIGMKRALFKLGSDSRVKSRSSDGAFEVHIDKAWVQSKSWKIHLDDVTTGALPKNGVEIKVTDLHEGIARLFDRSASSFETNLVTKIRDHYAYIIQKGFKVSVNGRNVAPNLVQTIVDKKSLSGGIAPYIYETEHNGVRVMLTFGMYANFPSETELNDLGEGKRTKHSAGWTVICNDRVVLSHDTTHRTGWGEAGVPGYHSQFVALAGAVEFISNDASKLPVTTTKRGINLDSPLYANVKDVMRDAIKHFTGFTNHWKSDTPQRHAIQANTEPVDIREAAARIPEDKWQKVMKPLKGRKFVPDLPKAPTVKTHGRMSFEKPLDTISAVREFLEVPEDRPYSEVGAAAFDFVAGRARA